MVSVFTQPNCVRCPGVIRYLIGKVGEGNVEVIVLTENPEAHDFVVTELGFSSTPVVLTDKGSYAGNNQKEIASLL